MSDRFKMLDENGNEKEKGTGSGHRRPENAFPNRRGNPQGAGRLLALDAARGLAVIGMYLQHFASNERITTIVSGNSTLLFVLCGGISYSIMAQRMKDRQKDATAFRAKMLARAVFIDIMGYLLIMLNTPFGVILPAYAAMFVLALILAGLSNRTLVTTTVALMFLAPPLMLLGMSALSGAFLLRDVAGGPMSTLALAPAFVAGMAIGSLELTKKRTAFLLATGGLMLLIIGKTLAAYVLPELSRSFESWLVTVQGIAAMPDPYAIWPLNMEQPMWHMLLWTVPHSASTFQTLTGLGFALLVVGIVFLVPKKTNALLVPFAGVGRVALTMYAAQFVVVWLLTLSRIDYSLAGVPLGDLLVALITLVAGWLISRLPQGPLESSMRHFDRLFSVPRSITAPK
ncbi:DUF418 domain-containing protein [Paenibacillus chitinolyticus]|uniref:DUF418 domain-containing protein n=1 Tax=Paenibacillus chitinolyticus TaxID=79263 RepID=UPI0035D52CBB